jgi:hypothetical protein
MAQQRPENGLDIRNRILSPEDNKEPLVKLAKILIII